MPRNKGTSYEDILCRNCGNLFKARSSPSKKGETKFCSKKCRNIFNAPLNRFERRVKKENGKCWSWFGSHDSKGYGKIWFRGKWEGAHRVSFILFNREIKDGFFICHSCDNPGCVNPEHLWEGIQADNMRDMKAKGRRLKGINSKKDRKFNYVYTLNRFRRLYRKKITKKASRESRKD